MTKAGSAHSTNESIERIHFRIEKTEAPETGVTKSFTHRAIATFSFCCSFSARRLSKSWSIICVGVAVTVEVWDVGLSSRCSFLKWALFKRKHPLIQRKFHQIKLCQKFIMRGDIMTATARRWDKKNTKQQNNSQVLIIQSMNQSTDDRPTNHRSNKSINQRSTYCRALHSVL